MPPTTQADLEALPRYNRISPPPPADHNSTERPLLSNRHSLNTNPPTYVPSVGSRDPTQPPRCHMPIDRRPRYACSSDLPRGAEDLGEDRPHPLPRQTDCCIEGSPTHDMVFTRAMDGNSPRSRDKRLEDKCKRGTMRRAMDEWQFILYVTVGVILGITIFAAIMVVVPRISRTCKHKDFMPGWCRRRAAKE